VSGDLKGRTGISIQFSITSASAAMGGEGREGRRGGTVEQIYEKERLQLFIRYLLYQRPRDLTEKKKKRERMRSGGKG